MTYKCILEAREFKFSKQTQQIVNGTDGWIFLLRAYAPMFGRMPLVMREKIVDMIRPICVKHRVAMFTPSDLESAAKRVFEKLSKLQRAGRLTDDELDTMKEIIEMIDDLDAQLSPDELKEFEKVGLHAAPFQDFGVSWRPIISSVITVECGAKGNFCVAAAYKMNGRYHWKLLNQSQAERKAATDFRTFYNAVVAHKKEVLASVGC